MFDDQHMTHTQYEMLLRGEIPPRRLLYRLFQHLLAVCPACQGQWQSFRESRESPGAASREDDGLAVLDNFALRAGELIHRAELEKSEAPALLEELLALPGHKARVTRVRRSRRFRSWALCDLLFRESRRTAEGDPRAGEALAELALETAWCLEGSGLSRESVADLMARGWACLAHARRWTIGPALAEETLLLAYFFLDQGTGDPSVPAEVLTLDASLQRSLGHFDLSLQLLHKVVAIHRRSGESHLQGKALLEMAVTRAETGDLDGALRTLRRGMRRISLDRDPRLHLRFRHTEVLYIQRMGRHQEAAERLEELALLYASFPDARTQLRRRWLAGRIAEGLGDLEEAEGAFRQVRTGFLEEGHGYDLALVSLDLAALLARQGRTPEIAALAGRMLQIFESREVHREAITALILFEKAARGEAVTLEGIRELRTYLERARNNPEMRFEQPS